MWSEDEQERLRDMLNLSGEFLVAGELLRRNIPAAITYGNAKKCDVIARNGRTIILIKVRATRDSKWGNRNHPEVVPDDAILVFVNLPRDRSAPAEFFVLTAVDLQAVLKARKVKIMADGLPKREPINRDEVESHNGAWHKITTALGLPRGDWD